MDNVYWPCNKSITIHITHIAKIASSTANLIGSA